MGQTPKGLSRDAAEDQMAAKPPPPHTAFLSQGPYPRCVAEAAQGATKGPGRAQSVWGRAWHWSPLRTEAPEEKGWGFSGTLPPKGRRAHCATASTTDNLLLRDGPRGGVIIPQGQPSFHGSQMESGSCHKTRFETTHDPSLHHLPQCLTPANQS